jgi:hypothetical protein
MTQMMTSRLITTRLDAIQGRGGIARACADLRDPAFGEGRMAVTIAARDLSYVAFRRFCS